MTDYLQQVTKKQPHITLKDSSKLVKILLNSPYDKALQGLNYRGKAGLSYTAGNKAKISLKESRTNILTLKQLYNHKE